MSENKHHPSCKPNDRMLLYVCSQCGQTEAPEVDKEEEIDQLKAERADLYAGNAELMARCAAKDRALIEAHKQLALAGYKKDSGVQLSITKALYHDCGREMVEALEFYADEKVYEGSFIAFLRSDKGEKARKALGK